MSTIEKSGRLLNRLPHIYEIDKMLEFCGKYEHI